MIVDRIYKYLSDGNNTLDEELSKRVGELAKYSVERQFMKEPESSGVLRLSGCGKCARHLAYKYHNVTPNGKDIDGRSKINFFMGDVTELLLMSLAQHAGAMLVATGKDQLTVELEIGGQKIKGHPDGVLWHNGEWILVECKSMPKDRYERFDKGQIDEDYVAQVNAYMHCLGLNKCCFIALNKNNGVIGEQVITKDENVVKYILNNLNIVLQSSLDKLPERKYAPDEKGFYPWNCLYCGHWKTCLPNAEEVLVSKRYKLKEKKCQDAQSALTKTE